MRKIFRFVAVCALAVFPFASIAGESFDGTWDTKYTCPEKGNTKGFTFVFPTVIQKGNLRGERGMAGQPGYFMIEGKVADDGSVKLSASGIVNNKEYARGIFTGKGTEYSFSGKAQFKDASGTGLRNEGLGIVGRPCTFEFTKQQPAATDGGAH
jgi:hypothetical protein